MNKDRYQKKVNKYKANLAKRDSITLASMANVEQVKREIDIPYAEPKSDYWTEAGKAAKETNTLQKIVIAAKEHDEKQIHAYPRHPKLEDLTFEKKVVKPLVKKLDKALRHENLAFSILHNKLVAPTAIDRKTKQNIAKDMHKIAIKKAMVKLEDAKNLREMKRIRNKPFMVIISRLDEKQNAYDFSTNFSKHKLEKLRTIVDNLHSDLCKKLSGYAGIRIVPNIQSNGLFPPAVYNRLPELIPIAHAA